MVTPEQALEIMEPALPEVVRLGSAKPLGTIALATEMANALSDIVEKKKLFATISGKKFPTVEAWMTIARMDNVVAREMRDGVAQQDDGSFEAQVELIRLSDGMVIGHGSALCGTPGDKPWDSRPMPQRRSMAVTRATSRAFRQQYSWIMALAGYEPTPAEEMPRDEEPAKPQRGPNDGLVGTAEVGKARDSDFQLRKEGADERFFLGFKLKSNGGGFKVIARDELALQLLDVKEEVVGKFVTVWGRITTVYPGDTDKWRAYERVDAVRIKTTAGILPVVSPLREGEPEPVPLAEGQQGFDMVESARLDAEEAARA